MNKCKCFILLIFISLIFSTIHAQNNDELITMSGEILSAEDTGLGPFYGVVIKDQINGQEKYFMIMIDDLLNISSDGYYVGKFVDVAYKINNNIFITDLMLESEYDSSPSQAHVYLSGKFISGDIGDMGSYITLEKEDGTTITYLGDFELDVTNTKYLNKNVILYFEEQMEDEVVSLSLQDSESSLITGKITDVYPGDDEGMNIIIIENENEIIDAFLPSDVFGGEIEINSLLNKSVQVEYSAAFQKVIISYGFESSSLNEAETSDEAVKFFEYSDKLTDTGRYVDRRIENGNVYLDIETADGPIFENVLVYPGLGLDDQERYQDQELIFTYVIESIYTVNKISVLD